MEYVTKICEDKSCHLDEIVKEDLDVSMHFNLRVKVLAAAAATQYVNNQYDTRSALGYISFSVLNQVPKLNLGLGIYLILRILYKTLL